MDTEIVSGGLEGGFFHGTYSYKDEWGNSIPCE